jgi:hypothetical protein
MGGLAPARGTAAISLPGHDLGNRGMLDGHIVDFTEGNLFPAPIDDLLQAARDEMNRYPSVSKKPSSPVLNHPWVKAL